MKRILSKGKVIVSYISVFAILATSLVAVFTGTPFLATAATLEDMGSGSGAEETVTYPLNGKYDADYAKPDAPGITYTEVDLSKKTRVDQFTGYDYTFCVDPNTEGNGTAANPYIIKTANQFAAVVTGNLKDSGSAWISTEGLCFKIADDVLAFNLKNTGSSVDFSKDTLTAAEVEAALKGETVPTELKWENKSGKPFMGRFDGNGAQVYGLKAEAGYVAIFPKVGGNITVKNLTVKNCYFIGNTAGALFGGNVNPGKSSTFNTKHYIFNCQVYNNVVISNYVIDEAIQKAGILIGQTEWPTESNLIVTDCLAYGNTAKHETRPITYGMVGNLHRSGSLVVNSSILMDSAPHALYYGSNAHLTSSYLQMYTNMIGIEPWSNTDTTKSGGTYTYTYSYTLSGGIPTVNFDRVNKDGESDVDGGKGYHRALSTSTVYSMKPEEIKGATELAGIDPEKWTFNKNGYPTPKIYNIREYSEGNTWSGEVSVQYAEGDGSDKAPYAIYTAEDLVLMLTTAEAGKYFRLAADININDVTVPNWTDNAKTWFTSNDVPVFEASLDGNGYTIRGIYYDGTQAGESVGLIPVVGNTAKITNLKIADSVIKADKGYAGAVAGSIADKCAKVINFGGITVENSVKFEGEANVGGMIGHIGYSVVKINDCISKINGLFYDVTGEAKVKRSVSVGAYPFATTERIKAEDVYTDTDATTTVEGVTVVPNDAMKGDAATSSMPGLLFPTSWSAVANDYPAPTGAAASAEGTVGEVWSGAIATKYAGGTGTKEDPILIETPEQLAKLVSSRYRPGGGAENIKYYKLTADIYINDVNSELWAEKIGCQDWFSQWVNGNYITNSHINLDGDGHVIFGLYYDHTQGAIEYVRVGLFPVLCEYSTIENVGLSDVYFVGEADREDCLDSMGGFVGAVEDYDKFLGLDSHDAAGNKVKLEDPANGYEEMTLKIKNCFVDHRSYIHARYAGGFIASPYSAPILENCIFTGRMSGPTTDSAQYYYSAFTGTDSTYGTQLRSCVSFPINTSLKLVAGSNGSSWRSASSYWVTYATGTYYFSTTMSYGGDFIKISNPNDRISDAAQEAMPLLDWENTWRTVEGGTPILTVFEKNRNEQAVNDKRVFITDAEYFSLKDYTPPTTQLSFSTGDPDITIEPIEAPMYSPLTLPTISRPGYEFLGWFVYDDPAVLYDLGYHPARELTLYAGWEQKGISQTFDEYPNSIWDCDGENWILNTPGAKGGYKNKYVRNGSKSMHLTGLTSDPVDCLLNYKDMLEPGKSYTISFWVNTDKVDNPATLLSLVHNTKPDYLNSAYAVENMAVVTGLKVDEWVQYSFSFKALTKWISLRATGAASLWFDDVVVAELEGDITGGKYTEVNGTLSPSTGNTISVTVLISVIMSCAIVAVISRKNLVEVIED